MEKENPPLFIETSNIVTVSKTASAILIIGNVVVSIFSLCGAIVALIVCFRSKFGRYWAPMFTMLFIVGDFVLASLSIAASLSQLFSKYNAWILGPFMCTVMEYGAQVSLVTNILINVTMATETYVAIERPHSTCILPSTRCSFTKMTLLCLMGIVLPVPQLFRYSRVEFLVIPQNQSDLTMVTTWSTMETFHICARQTDRFTSLDWLYEALIGLLFLAMIGAFFLSISSFRTLSKRIMIGPTLKAADGVTRIGQVAASLAASSHGHHQHHDGGKRVVNSMPTKKQIQTAERSRNSLRLIMFLTVSCFISRLPPWFYTVIVEGPTTAKMIQNQSALHVHYFFALLSNLKSSLNPYGYLLRHGTPKKRYEGVHRRRCAFLQKILCAPCSCHANSREENVTSYSFEMTATTSPSATSVQAA